MRWMNRAATAMIALMVVAGPPLLAAVWLQHHPWQPPTPVQLQAWTRQPPTADTILVGFIAIAAAGWLTLVWHMTRRGLGHAVRGWRRLRHLPLPTPAQMTAGSMAGVAALTFPHTEPSPPTTTPPAPEHTTDHPSRPAHASPAGIELPGGGWLPYPTALTISALATLLWRHRSHRPGATPAGSHPTNPEQALPTTVDAITAALDNAPPPETAGTALLIGQLPSGVLHLDGPGAAAAARGLLVTTALTAAATATPTQPLRLQARDLPRLLPGLDPRHPQLAGLLTPAGTDMTPPATDSDGTDGDPHHDPALTATSTGRQHQTSRTPVTTLTLTGTTGAAAHWHVTADGTVTEPGNTRSRRLCVLDERATLDLLDLVHRTRTLPEAATTITDPPARAPETPSPGGGQAARLTLLDTCQLTVAGNPVKLRRTAALQILAYLAIHDDGATRSELIQALWPDLPPATITQRFYTTLTDLRKQLLPLIGGDPVIRLGDRYRLNREIIDTDLYELDSTAWQLRAPGPPPVHDPTQRLAAGWNWPWLAYARLVLRDNLDQHAAKTKQPRRHSEP